MQTESPSESRDVLSEKIDIKYTQYDWVKLIQDLKRWNYVIMFNEMELSFPEES